MLLYVVYPLIFVLLLLTYTEQNKPCIIMKYNEGCSNVCVCVVYVFMKMGKQCATHTFWAHELILHAHKVWVTRVFYYYILIFFYFFLLIIIIIIIHGGFELNNELERERERNNYTAIKKWKANFSKQKKMLYYIFFSLSLKISFFRMYSIT